MEKSPSRTTGLIVLISPVVDDEIEKNPSSRAFVELVTVVVPPSFVDTTEEDDSIFTSPLNRAAW